MIGINRHRLLRQWVTRGSICLRLCRLHQPRGIALLLWPIWSALWLAGADAILAYWVPFTMGAVAMRTLGCLLNDYCDQDIDRHVWRTKQRPLVTKQATYGDLLGCIMISALLALVCLYLLPIRCWLFAIAITPVVVIYPTAKRWCPFPQIVLSLAFSWGIPMVFLAVNGHIPVVAWIFMAIHMIWIFAYDTQYALADLHDDSNLPIFSSAKTLGCHTQVVIDICHLIIVIGFGGLILSQGWALVGWFFLMGLVMGFLKMRSWTLSGQPEQALNAFLYNNYLNAWMCSGIVLAS